MLNLTEAQNITNETVFGAVQAVNLMIFDNWQKTVLTTATASGTISYLFMLFVLYSQYSVLGGCICGNIKECWREIWRLCVEKLKPDSPSVL